jgi:hypothetical protein
MSYYLDTPFVNDTCIYSDYVSSHFQYLDMLRWEEENVPYGDLIKNKNKNLSFVYMRQLVTVAAGEPCRIDQRQIMTSSHMTLITENKSKKQE